MSSVTFVVKDGNGDNLSLETSTQVAKKVPYLHTLVTTQVGHAGAPTHDICLPRGCTTQAFASLLKRVDTHGNDLQFSWIADAAASVALICVADFLMLTDVIPELVSHCSSVAKSASDIKLLLVLKVAHPAVMKLVKDLRNGPLAGAITVEQATQILRDMKYDNACVCFSAQAMALGQWLLHSDRTIEELAIFSDSFPAYILWKATSSSYELKNDALHFVSSLVHVAKQRPPFLTLLLKCIFKFDYSGSDIAVKSLVGTVFKDVTKGTPLKAEEIKVLMCHAVRNPYIVGVHAHLASLSDGCTQEGKETLTVWLGSCDADTLSRVVSIEFLQSLGATNRATIVAQALTRGRNCDPKVVAFIKEAVANGDI